MHLLLTHLVGDYILQSDWMALNKSKRSWPCLVHVLIYTACFIPFASWQALIIIGATHFAIDRYGLAKYLIWLKNHMAPGMRYHPWEHCRVTGYQDQEIAVKDVAGGITQVTPPSRPFWLTLMLFIVADNTLHLICNELAVRLFP